MASRYPPPLMCDHVIIWLTPPLPPVINCEHLAYSPLSWSQDTWTAPKWKHKEEMAERIPTLHQQREGWNRLLQADWIHWCHQDHLDQKIWNGNLRPLVWHHRQQNWSKWVEQEKSLENGWSNLWQPDKLQTSWVEQHYQSLLKICKEIPSTSWSKGQKLDLSTIA